MSAGAVAERYAQALFELGLESGELSTLVDGLSDFALTYESSSELRRALGNPTLSPDQQNGVLAAVAKRLAVPDLGIKGLFVMARRGRLPALSATVTRLIELSDEKNGVIRARISTAAKMPDSYYQELSSQIEAATHKKVVLEREVDESLVGGAVAQIGDQVIDGSVRGRLEQVERELLSAVVSGSNITA